MEATVCSGIAVPPTGVEPMRKPAVFAGMQTIVRVSEATFVAQVTGDTDVIVAPLDAVSQNLPQLCDWQLSKLSASSNSSTHAHGW